MSDFPKEVKTKEDAERCVRVIFRKFLDGSQAFAVQMVAPTHCNECGHVELAWKDINNLPLKDNTRLTYKEAKAKAKAARLNLIDMLVQNTTIMEKVVK